MSLSWANVISVNQLLVFLGTDKVVVINRSRGLRSRVADQKQATFQGSIETIEMQTPAWQQTIVELESIFSAMQIKPGTRLNITLASEFVRYLSLPALQIRMNATEKLGYVAAAYQDVYGKAVNNWEITLQDAPANEATLAAAIDKELLAALNRIALKHQLILNSVQPYLMRAFNALSGQIDHASGYLVIVESKRLLLINLQDGKYQHLRAYAISGNWQFELKNLILREALLANADKREVLIYVPAQKNIVLNVIDGWQLKLISTLKNVIPDIQYSMLEVAL